MCFQTTNKHTEKFQVGLQSEYSCKHQHKGRISRYLTPAGNQDIYQQVYKAGYQDIKALAGYQDIYH